MTEKTSSVKDLYLLDASSYLYRAFHALPKFTTKDGFPTGAIYGFVRMLLSLLKRKNVKYIAVCFDSKAPTFRHSQFADYKKNRPPMPEDLSVQLPKINQLLAALNLKCFKMDGYEADDILATLAWRFKDYFDKILIVTSDKDMLQIVNDKIAILNSSQKENILDPEAVREKLGVYPEKVTDLLALIGDSVDNIPGIPGIGEKTAKALLEEFGFLEDVIASKDKIKDKKISKSLELNSSLALNNKKLLILDKNVPIEAEVKELEVGIPAWSGLNKLFEELQFKKLAKEFTPTLFS
ncbi:MAG: 5'-3' exonuclease H3TH domain-containing protein [Candidatus Ratteibacteria bacterium]|nr:5'-3' exonuclease H3TH domain-containing protein [Candidatus Ratteibacteria bacterium]